MGEEEKKDNVVSIGQARALKEAKLLLPEQEETDFSNEIEKNKRVQERLEKERKKSNKSVLRSYRIKNDNN